MIYTAIVEIPRGCDRRIHKSNDTDEFIDFGPTKDAIPVNDGKMPVCYGFLKGIMNVSEGDEVDLLIFSEKEYATGDELEVEILGLIEREDGDHKIISKDNSVAFQSIKDIDGETWDLVLSYFGFKHKITSIKNKEEALEYLEHCSIN